MNFLYRQAFITNNKHQNLYSIVIKKMRYKLRIPLDSVFYISSNFMNLWVMIKDYYFFFFTSLSIFWIHHSCSVIFFTPSIKKAYLGFLLWDEYLYYKWHTVFREMMDLLIWVSALIVSSLNQSNFVVLGKLSKIVLTLQNIHKLSARAFSGLVVL